MITVTVPRFGDVALADGGIAVMDGGVHGVQGHTIVVPAAGEAMWERRLDGMRPSGEAGRGTLVLTDGEAARVRAWAADLWELAAAGQTLTAIASCQLAGGDHLVSLNTGRLN